MLCPSEVKQNTHKKKHREAFKEHKDLVSSLLYWMPQK